MTVKDFLKNEVSGYLKTISVTQEERDELIAWVRGGNSVYDNPWLMADEQGRPLDYITAVREVNDYRITHGL